MKIALVTGGTKGIGFECIKRFHSEGFKVVTCSRSKSDWEKILVLRPELGSVSYIECDVSKEKDLGHL